LSRRRPATGIKIQVPNVENITTHPKEEKRNRWGNDLPAAEV
jgi:hypothetical protein